MVNLLRKAGAAAVFLFATGNAVVSAASDQASDSNKPAEVQAGKNAESPSDGNGAARSVSDRQVIAVETAAVTSNESCGCDRDGCDVDMCDCCQPNWYLSAGMVYLTRSTPSPGRIVTANPAGTEFSGGDDFDFGWDVGPDVTLARRMASGDMVEARYFAVDSDASHPFVTPGNFIGAGFTGPGGTNFLGEYLTQLDSAELNWRRAWSDRLTFLAGFRYLELRDDLAYRLNTTVAAGRYEYDNHLYGGQIGADLALADPCAPFQLNLVGKAGYFVNYADGGVRLFAPANNQIVNHDASDSAGAFVGEVGISAAYQLTSRMAVRGGYQVLWITDVALASDNAAFSRLNPTLLNTSYQTGDLFYHGATAAIDIVW